MSQKVYAVRKGKRTGLFNTWEECKEVVNGFRGAEYRSFKTVEEAEAYMRGESVGKDNTTGSTVVIDKPTEEDVVNLYTDGSFKNNNIAIGICLESTTLLHKFYGVVDNSRYLSIRNIAGELFAVLVGVQLANNMGFKRVNIIYDYDGVECWYKGIWKAKGELQSLYASLLNTFRAENGMTFNFIKVKGHSNVQGNIHADRMAKRASNFLNYINLTKILEGTITVNDVGIMN